MSDFEKDRAAMASRKAQQKVINDLELAQRNLPDFLKHVYIKGNQTLSSYRQSRTNRKSKTTIAAIDTRSRLYSRAHDRCNLVLDNEYHIEWDRSRNTIFEDNVN